MPEKAGVLLSCGRPSDSFVLLYLSLLSRHGTVQEFVGYKFNIHNGIKYKEVTVSEGMIGHKFGEFHMTRKRPNHPVKVDDRKKTKKK